MLVRPAIIALFYLLAQQCLHAQTAYRFDFGNGATAPGFTKITSDCKFSYQKGFGFDQQSVVQSVERKDKHPLTNDFITSAKPFFFSVKLPEGNYDVKLLLGDVAGTSATTVRAECRRLFFNDIKTKYGQIISKTFTVHVKDSIIRDADGEAVSKVRLKPREASYLHWDNLLTIEFNDSAAKICALEIIPNTKATTIFLAGNSTVVDQDREPWAAWGQMFPSFFKSGNVCVANYAESGETLKAFKGERRLDKIWSMAKAGDYLFIEFAHNDQKPGSNHLDPFTTYKQTLKEWIAEARKRNVIPVLVSSMNRRTFDSSGKITNSLGDYPEAMRQIAKEEGVALIDLNVMSKILYESWGSQQSIKAFVHYPANTFPHQPTELKDDTHFSTYGAFELARCVVQSIREQRLPLVKYIRKDVASFNPEHPDKYEQFYWPLSSFSSSTKPDGN